MQKRNTEIVPIQLHPPFWISKKLFFLARTEFYYFFFVKLNQFPKAVKYRRCRCEFVTRNVWRELDLPDICGCFSKFY